MTPTKLVIGSRGSDLALWQANFIHDILVKEHGCSVEIKIIKTSGDKLDQLSFDKMEGKGFSLVEFLSSCPINLRLKPVEAAQWVKERMTSFFPLGEFKQGKNK